MRVRVPQVIVIGVLAGASILLGSMVLRAQTPGVKPPVPNAPPGEGPCYTEPLDVYDMVQWMVQTYPGHENSYLIRDDGTGTISDYSIHDPVAHRFYRISGVAGYGNEVYDYDSSWIYIRRETRFENPGTFLVHPNYIWAPRYAVVVHRTGRSCNPVTSNSHYTYYSNCQVDHTGGPLFDIRVSAPPAPLNLGGDVGTVKTLKISSTNLTNGNSEYYWYAKGWGMVYFEKYIDGALQYNELYNTIQTPQPPLLLDCGIGY